MHDEMLTANDLLEFDEGFVEAEIEDNDFEPIPDGKYQVNVDKVELVKTKTGKPMLVWTLRILSPALRGRLIWKNSVISPRGLKWFKKDLVVAGLILDKISNLPDRLEDLLDVKLEITKRTRGENINIFFQDRIYLEDPGSTANDDDLIPF